MSSSECPEREPATTTRSITLITKHDPLTPVDGDIGLLLECPPDASLLRAFPNNRVFGLQQLIGGYDETKRRAYELTCKLLEGESPTEDVRQLLVIRESLIQALEEIFHGLNLANWLKNAGVEKVIFRGPSPYWQTLRNLQRYVGASYRIDGTASESVSTLGKVRDYIRNAGVQGSIEAAAIFARQLYPCHARYFAAMPNARRTNRRGGWWFYSTAYTFTNIGLAYEPYLPQPLNYLCESSGSSFGPLREREREAFDIYAWGELRDLPSRAEMKAIAEKLSTHVRGTQLDRDDDDLARQVLLDSDMFRKYLTRRLPLLVYHARLLKRWLQDVRPERIIVGNPGQEGVLLQLAHARGIPTVVLQHGILGDYYQISDQAGDVLIVRGEFWRNFVADIVRERTFVLNMPGVDAGRWSRTGGSNILFLSYTDNAVVHAHPSDLKDILCASLRVAAEASRTLVVRVHPMEQVGYFRRIVDEICLREGLSPKVEYSQGPGLEQVLQQSAVAITYASTVFLDCLRLGVPLVSFDWHEFSYKSHIADEGAFHFATSLQQFSDMLRLALAGQLAPSTSYSYFLAPTTRAEIQSFFQAQDRRSQQVKART